MRPPLPPGNDIVPVVGAAIVEGLRCFVARRNPGGTSGGLWEFPGGKIEPDESPEQALTREMEEEFAVSVDVGSWLGRGEFASGARRIVLDVYRCRLVSGVLKNPGPDHQEVLWAEGEQLRALNWAVADIPLVPLVQKLLSEDR